jgi:hypothetical protein
LNCNDQIEKQLGKKATNGGGKDEDGPTYMFGELELDDDDWK